MDIRKIVLDNIQKKYTLPENADIETFNYIENGFVDSIGMIHFFVSLEDSLDVEFTEDEMTCAALHTIGGLISALERKVAERERA